MIFALKLLVVFYFMQTCDPQQPHKHERGRSPSFGTRVKEAVHSACEKLGKGLRQGEQVNSLEKTVF